MNLKNHFDKIYCINLDRRVDRWDESKAEFKKWNMESIVERYPAIDGKLLPVNPDNNFLDAGNMGLITTHINLLTESIKEGYENILLLEDDIYFTPEILNYEEYLGMVPDDWDMIYFGGNHNLHMGATLNKINDKVARLHSTYGLQCIVVKNTLFRPMLDTIREKKVPIDVYYTKLAQKNYNCYGFYPSMALQRVSFSDLQNQVMDNRWLF
tara:strand:+ start:116 stop:748 length:633 start_codon:yes stop_codon:yes gene_type:complete